MKPRFSLSAKILLWFFLNLLILAAGFYVVLRGQFRFGLDLLISGRGGERVQGLANVLAAELAEQPREAWNETLHRFAAGYGVKLLILRADSAPVAGEELTLPREVLERLRDRPSLGRQRFSNREFSPEEALGNLPQPKRPREPRPPVESESDSFLAPERPPPRGQLPEADLPRQGVARLPASAGEVRPEFGLDTPPPPQPRPRFMVHTSTPTRYWVGVPLPPIELIRGRLTLLVVSDSLHGGGLFFDFTPWLIAAGAVVVLSVLFWLPLVRGITGTIAQTTRATREIAEGRFDTHVPEGRNDELGVLAAAVNRMASRLAGFVSGQKRFLGDTAHELCAPIARMQMALGILEQRANENQRPYVNDVREELQHISALVNELLSFSKAGLRSEAVALQLVDVGEIARRVAEREGKSGGAIQVEMTVPVTAHAEPELLTRALANVVRNALRYAGNAGPVAVSARSEREQVVITVSDQGPGVPDSALQKIFDPFYRLEESRSRETGGAGLGLAIVKTCVEACGGTVTASNRQPQGLEVTIRLQRA